MAWGDGFYRKAKAKVEQQTGEPVEVIGWASRSGAMGAVIAGTALRGAEVAAGSAVQSGVAAPRGRMQAGGGEKGSKLPMNFMVALTPTALRVFKIRKTWTGLKLKKESERCRERGFASRSRTAGSSSAFASRAPTARRSRSR
jgi:hypothetical protein